MSGVCETGVCWVSLRIIVVLLVTLDLTKIEGNKVPLYFGRMPFHIHYLKGFCPGGVVIPLIFPKVPQSSLGILRVPQLPPPLGHPPIKNPIIIFDSDFGCR